MAQQRRSEKEEEGKVNFRPKAISKKGKGGTKGEKGGEQKKKVTVRTKGPSDRSTANTAGERTQRSFAKGA